ncbi:hypothetical protein TEA_001890 [Camellia sinensis var. sinensis]|uniref:BHLH domain-containing protein n=1 Tax=Camellia sinensis var. sinensis TaxID=542762 RepID=A0A4S4DVF1_CAMSN|nr:hypothetical protein TEA_001890 [Camellia sinensis var. sinensis]
MELIVNHFTELNALGNQNLNFHTFLDFSSPLEFPGNLAENFPGIFHDIDNNVLPAAEPVVVSGVNDFHESKKRKAMDVSESSSGNSLMLDEIINYVQSLQNQVEFLSMKLTAASTIYDFNSETDDMEAMQRAKAYEAEKVVKKGCEGLASTQLGPFDLTFGSYSSLPFNT